jgi:hypothetical protein
MLTKATTAKAITAVDDTIVVAPEKIPPTTVREAFWDLLEKALLRVQK